MPGGVAASPRMKLEPGVSFLREVVTEWRKDNALSLGAALAFYALFSLAPLLVLIIAIVGLVFGRAAAQGEIVARVAGAGGPEAAKVIEGMIARASAPASGVIATVASLATMLFGASGVFGQLQAALNQIWGVTAGRARGVRGLVRRRLTSFSLILGIGLLLFLSLVVSAVLAAVNQLLAEHLPVLSALLPPLNFLVSFLMISALFALIFKVLPDAPMHWRDVWFGAAVTALLFTLGKTLIALYLGRTGRASVYGAAASLVVLLLWVYYSAQILLVGAEFTEVYSRRYGSRRGDRVRVAGGARGFPASFDVLVLALAQLALRAHAQRAEANGARVRDDAQPVGPELAERRVALVGAHAAGPVPRGGEQALAVDTLPEGRVQGDLGRAPPPGTVGRRGTEDAVLIRVGAVRRLVERPAAHQAR